MSLKIPSHFVETDIPYKFFLEEEVKAHCTSNDCWISLFGLVFDMTPLVTEATNTMEAQPILDAAGSDITHWFNSDGNVRTCIDQMTEMEVPYTPQGRFFHCPPRLPDARWVPDFEVPWWKDQRYVLGYLSTSPRKVFIVNTLTTHRHLVTVPNEETLSMILERYKKYNNEGHAYVWKYKGKRLNMDISLKENGIEDEADNYSELNIPEEMSYPAIHLYFTDSLDVAVPR
ncbi:hypothetical protein PCE1_002748 [Barthelona sp. PCE]